MPASRRASRRASHPLTFADVCALAARLPGVEVLKVPFTVRDHLLVTAPATYFLTDHYRGYPAVLVRLTVADAAGLAPLLEEAWRQVAPKRMLQEYEARENKMSHRSLP